MDGEIRRLNDVRSVFRQISMGRGVAASFVLQFKNSKDKSEKEVARRFLLGMPYLYALQSIKKGEWANSALISYILSGSMLNLKEAGVRARRLSFIFESWLKLKEKALIDERILRTRAYMLSGILGAILAFLVSFAPVLSVLISFGTRSQISDIIFYTGLLMASISSLHFGLLFSISKVPYFIAISLISYLLAINFLAPVSRIEIPELWAIKY